MVTYIKNDLAFVLKQIKIADGDLAFDLGNPGNGDGDGGTDKHHDGADDDAPVAPALGSFLGTPQDDVLIGTSGNDLVFGFAGTDYIITDAGPDIIRAGAGSDFMDGAGRGIIFGEDGEDLFASGDDDMVDAGGNGDDVFTASLDDGNDTLWGAEDVVTGSGNDKITTSNAVNVVDGGQGRDVFIFGSPQPADGGTIRGFEPGDKIDLSGIDANAGTTGNDTFTLESGQTTIAPGQIVVTHETREDGEYTVISADTAGTDAPEFRITIAGNHALTAADINL